MSPATDSKDASEPWKSRVARTLGVLAITLAVASWLVPGDGPSATEIGGLLTAGWMLVALVIFIGGKKERLPRARWADGFVVFWLVWVMIAAAYVVWSGTGWVRPIKALSWQSIGGAVLYLLGRWSWTDLQVGRWTLGLVLGGLGLLTGLAAFQVMVRMPQDRAGYFEASEMQKQQMLLEAGVAPVDPQSRARRNFEDRLRSLEPTASFTLANSLGLVLAVGWTLGINVIFPPRSRISQQSSDAARRPNDRTILRRILLVIAVLGLVAMAAILVLTKSRAALLAGGLATLVWMIEWVRVRGALRWLIAGGALGLVGIVAAFASGFLDLLVLTQAPKSLAYRVEYWQATVPMIAATPVFGVGPGSFQDRYRQYQLPQASETVADPHNAWIEAAAVSGVPAGLALLLLSVTAVVSLRRSRMGPSGGEAAGDDSKFPDDSAVSEALYDPITVGPGLFLGTLVAAPLLVFQGLFPDLMAWGWALIPAMIFGVACGWLANRPASYQRAIAKRAVGAGLAVAATTLLVTGGYSFWGVSQLVWWLLGSWITLSCVAGEEAAKDSRVVVPRGSVSKLSWGIMALGGMTLAIGLQQVVIPQIQSWKSRLEVRIALASGNPRRVEIALNDWIAEDPQSEEPLRWLYEASFSRWRSSDQPEDRERFDRAVARYEQLRPRYSGHHLTLGGSYLAIWGERGRDEFLEESLVQYRRAAELAPYDALTQAQLARILQLSGRLDEARQVATRSLELDRLNPHRDRDLRVQFLIGPQGPEPISAKERLEEIIKSSS